MRTTAIILLLALTAQLAANPVLRMAAAARHRDAGGGATWLWSETFEGSEAASGDAETGYDLTGWTATNSAVTPNYATAPAPLVGSYSWANGGNVARRVYRALDTPLTEVWVYLRFEEGATSTNKYVLVQFEDSSNVALGTVQPRATRDEIYQFHGAVNDEASNLDSWTDEASENHLWVHFVSDSDDGVDDDDGTLTIYHSTTGTKPGSPSRPAITTGTADGSIGYIEFGAPFDATQGAIDSIIVSETDPGSNPTP